MGIVDCAVHEPFDQGGVARYTNPVWDGWHAIVPPFPYRVPTSLRRPATYESLCEEVLDAHDVELAVLSGSIHPGNAVTQFEYHAAFASAYNDWLAGEWLARDDRLYGSVQVTSQLPEEAAEEIERWGTHPRMLQVVLPARGGEGFGLGHYRPIFEAAARNDFPVAFHLSDSSRSATGFGQSLPEWHATANQSFMGQLLSLAFSGLFEERPNLKVVCMGGGWTWVPYLAWTMDSNYRPLRAEVPWVRRLPSEYFSEQLFFGVNPVPDAPSEHLERIIEMSGHDGWLVWGSEYPNPTFASPVALNDPGFPEELRRKICHDNAMRLYGPRLARIGAPGG